jgi:hypothetical protein
MILSCRADGQDQWCRYRITDYGQQGGDDLSDISMLKNRMNEEIRTSWAGCRKAVQTKRKRCDQHADQGQMQARAAFAAQFLTCGPTNSTLRKVNLPNRPRTKKVHDTVLDAGFQSGKITMCGSVLPAR